MAHRILLAEDELGIREVYQELLEASGYEVDTAVNGQIAFDKLSEGGYDAVLLDIVMPEMDGLTVLKMLEQQPPKKKNGPVVLLTVLANDSAISDGLTHGASGYLIKSEINPDDVVKEVEGLLSK